MNTFESPRQRARRLRVTMTTVYAELAADRLPGAYKLDNRWYIPVDQTPQPTVPDFKSLAAGRDE